MNIEQLITRFIRIHISQNQRENISAGVFTYQKKIERIYRSVFGLLSVGFLTGSIFAFINMVQAISQSGFGQYVSLVFSDGGVVLSYWKEFLFSLVESIPVTGVILCLGAMTLFVWSLGKTAKHAVAIPVFSK